MPRIKTATLVPPALDWAVAKGLGATRIQPYEYNGQGFLRVSLAGGVHAPWEPSRYWNQGGPIIAEHTIELLYFGRKNPGPDDEPWEAQLGGVASYIDQHQGDAHPGPTPLIAAMRALVASKFGDAIDIPEALL